MGWALAHAFPSKFPLLQPFVEKHFGAAGVGPGAALRPVRARGRRLRRARVAVLFYLAAPARDGAAWRAAAGARAPVTLRRPPRERAAKLQEGSHACSASCRQDAHCFARRGAARPRRADRRRPQAFRQRPPARRPLSRRASRPRSSAWAASGAPSASSGRRARASSSPRSATRRPHPQPDLRGGVLGPHRPRRGRAVAYDPAKISLRGAARRCSGRTTTRPRACARATTSGRSTARRSTGRRPSSARRRCRSAADVRRSAEGQGLRRDHHRDRRSRAVLFRRGLPPAISRQEPRRLLRPRRHRRLLPDRRRRARRVRPTGDRALSPTARRAVATNRRGGPSSRRRDRCRLTRPSACATEACVWLGIELDGLV